MLRTHTCGELRTDHADQTVTLCGWVDKYRDHAGIVFIDLRDRYGKTQLKFDLADSSDIQQLARTLRYEDVIQATGKVVKRPDGLSNPKLATGEVELLVSQLTLLNKSKTPPFEPEGRVGPERRNSPDAPLHRPAAGPRSAESDSAAPAHDGRPRLLRPAGVPRDRDPDARQEHAGRGSRLPASRAASHEGQFYALPQSPQLYKQLLMVGGMDRYFQIARCFRDEDLRADRQPEFTQIDVEMAFVERDDILSAIDGLVAEMASTASQREDRTAAQAADHHECMEKYGSDKPDLRFGLPIVDIAEIAAECDFGVFKQTIAAGNRVRGINAKEPAEKYSRKMLDVDMKNLVADYGAKGLAYFKVVGGKLESSIAKFFTEDQQRAIVQKFEGKTETCLLFVADTSKVSSARAGGDAEQARPRTQSL